MWAWTVGNGVDILTGERHSAARDPGGCFPLEDEDFREECAAGSYGGARDKNA